MSYCPCVLQLPPHLLPCKRGGIRCLRNEPVSAKHQLFDRPRASGLPGSAGVAGSRQAGAARGQAVRQRPREDNHIPGLVLGAGRASFLAAQIVCVAPHGVRCRVVTGGSHQLLAHRAKHIIAH
jgi:hypothetical protein